MLGRRIPLGCPRPTQSKDRAGAGCLARDQDEPHRCDPHNRLGGDADSSQTVQAFSQKPDDRLKSTTSFAGEITEPFFGC
jgi:hypothetical protein